VALWFTALPVGGRFEGAGATLQSLGVLAALAGWSAFAVNLILGARLRIIEHAFGGLDRLYRAHRRIGATVVILLVAHAALLFASRVVLLDLSFGLSLFTPSQGSVIFTGVLVLAALVAGVVASFFAPLRHGLFVALQRTLGLLFLLAGLHVFRTGGTKASSSALTVVMVTLAIAAAAGYVYRSVLGQLLVRRRHYRVTAVNELDDRVVELVLEPIRSAIQFVPGQFAFLDLDYPSPDIGPHPFSVTSAHGDTTLRFVVKALGDHTRSLHELPTGVHARVEGGFGGFSHLTVPGSRQVWIAGGIGITPFLSMARSLDPERFDVDLYYCTAHLDETYFADELAALAPERGFRLHLVPEDSDGFLTAERLRAELPDLADREVLICGPGPMLASLRSQLSAIGVPASQVHGEDFRFH
jgi:predicted ferric reductase